MRALLASFFIEGSTAENLLNHKGALGSFGAQTDLCYSLGLIPKLVFNNLTVIGEIRNVFAHSLAPLTFESPEVAELINGRDKKPGLQIPERYYRKSGTGTATLTNAPPQENRVKFQAAVVIAINVLVNSPWPARRSEYEGFQFVMAQDKE
jgi:hypothetical protein